MKIVFLLPDLGPGGAEGRTVEMAARLRDAGCEIAVALLRPKTTVAFRRRLEDQHIPVMAVRHRHGRRHLRRFCNHPTNDVVILHSAMTAPGLIGVLLRRQLSAHLVHSFTNTLRANRAGPRSIAERLAWLIDKILVHRADALHAVSADVGAQLRERFPRLALDVEIAPDLDVDARHDPHDSSVHILCSDRLAQADLRILTLGRIEPHKAHHVLLDALVLVIPARPGVHLVIAGDGRGREDLERRCAELGLAPNVTFIGETESPRTLIDWADVLVHCSLYEGLSRACLEALRRDLPVIAAATPASRELVRNYGQGAQLVPSGNSLALARRIERHPARPRQQPRLAPLAGASAVDRLLDLYTRVGGIAQ